MARQNFRSAYQQTLGKQSGDVLPQSLSNVYFIAQEEAERLGGNFVGTEHLLLGLIHEDDALAALILRNLGVDLDGIRLETEKRVPRGDRRPGEEMLLTPRGKRAIDLAKEEANDFGNNYFGSEHLLLGLIRERDGIAGEVLASLGVDLERTRQEVRRLQGAT